MDVVTRFLVVMLVFTLTVSSFGTAAAVPSVVPELQQKPSIGITHARFSTLAYGLTDAHMQRHYTQRVDEYSAQVESCLTYTLGVNGKADSGIHLYKFGQIVGWCYDGSRVTYHEYRYIIEAYNLWSFERFTSEVHQAYPSMTFWRDLATAQFTGSVVGVKLQSCYPTVSIQVNGDGSYWGATSIAPSACT